MRKNIFLSQKGSTLIESILALTFAVVIITAVVIAVTTSLSNSTFTKNQNQATQLAQEGLDIARYMKTSDYVAFSRLPNSVADVGPFYCPESEGTLRQITLDSYCGDKTGNFKKLIWINHSGNRRTSGKGCDILGSTYVSSEVSWTDAKCADGEYCHKVVLNTCLSDLEQLDNP